MAWTITFYQGLVQLATTSSLLLIVASAAVLAIRQPARRIRVIQWTLAGLLLLPGLAFVPGYPRWSILPTLDAPASSPPAVVVERVEPNERTEAWPSLAIEPDAGPMEEPIDEVRIASVEPRILVQAEMETTVDPQATMPLAIVPIAPQPKWEFALPGDFRSWIVIVYLSGVAGMALWSLIGLAALKRLLRSARPAEAACRDVLREVAGPRSDRVSLVVSARAGQPCAFACWRATIVLPQDLCDGDNSQKLRWALAHEWSHVDRGDVWSWSVSGIVRWFYFYQPLLWWLRHQLRLSQDFVADSQAAGAGSLPEDYAEFLTSFSASNLRPTLAVGLGIGGRISDLHRRVVMLVEASRPLEVASPRLWNLAVMPVAILILGAVACVGQQPEGVATEPKQALDPKEIVEPKPATRPKVIVESRLVTESSTEIAPTPPAPPEAPIGPAISTEADVKAIRKQVAPRKIAPGDGLIVDVIPNIESSQDGQARVLLRPEMKLEVDENGKISFGSLYGFISVRGSTLGEAQEQIQKHLLASQNLSHINVRVTFAREAAVVTPVIVQPPKGHVQAAPPASAVPDPAKVEFLEKMRKKGYVTPQQVAKVKGDSHSPRIKPGDFFNIEVEGTPNDHPVRPVINVDADGRVALGARYGKVNIQGKTLDEAEQAIREFLQKTLKNPQVQITYRDLEAPVAVVSGGTDRYSNGPTVSPYMNVLQNNSESKPGTTYQQFPGELPAPPAPPRIQTGEILNIEIAGGLLDIPPRMVAVVEPSGKVALGVHYGRIEVRGKTLEEAEEAIRHALQKVIKEPQVQVTYWRAADGDRIKDEEASKVKRFEKEIEELKTRLNGLKAGKSS